jgi:hypothetical protein
MLVGISVSEDLDGGVHGSLDLEGLLRITGCGRGRPVARESPQPPIHETTANSLIPLCYIDPLSSRIFYLSTKRLQDKKGRLIHSFILITFTHSLK